MMYCQILASGHIDKDSLWIFAVHNIIPKKRDEENNLDHTDRNMWPWTTKPVLSRWGIFVAIAKNTLYRAKL